MPDINAQKLSDLENLLIAKVKTGQSKDIELFIPSFSVDKTNTHKFKVYLIGINALLKKAAESSGVNLSTLSPISDELLLKINNFTLDGEATDLLAEIAVRYCNSVAKVTNYKYSTPVIKAIAKIESSPNDDLSLKALAKFNNISAGHFSSLFKKETGVTLTDYVNRRRVEYSKDFLLVGDLKIKEIAEMCGFRDDNYYIRLFKKYEGITPKKFRNDKVK